MNKTLAYFGLKYNHPGLWYLALFALTPHPYNKNYIYLDPATNEYVNAPSLPTDTVIPQANVLRDVNMREGDMLNDLKGLGNLNTGDSILYDEVKSKLDKDGQVLPDATISPNERSVLNRARRLERRKKQTQQSYKPEQIQAVQRKNELRSKSLNLLESSNVYPELDRGKVLENSYFLLRDKMVRDAVNDTGVLDRYYRQTFNQLKPGEESMPLVSKAEALAAKERLAGLDNESWDMLSGSHRAVNEIRREAVPAQKAITDATSPIGRGAKADTVRSLEKQQTKLRQEAARTGIDPRTVANNPPTLVPDANEVKANIPSYVANPESLEYIVDPNNPNAQAAKRKPLVVEYKPTPVKPNAKTGLERRLERIARARELAQGVLPLPEGTDTPQKSALPVLGEFDPDIQTRPNLNVNDRPINRTRTKPANTIAEDAIRESIRRDVAQSTRPGLPQLPPSLQALDPAYQEAIRQGLIDTNQLPTDQARLLLQNTPVAPREDPLKTVAKQAVNSASANTPAATSKVPINKNFETKRNLQERARDAFRNAGDWYINNIVNPGNIVNPSTNEATPPTPTAAAVENVSNVASAPARSKVIVNLPGMQGAQDAVSNAVKNVKRVATGQSAGVADIYDQMIRQQAFTPPQPQQAAEQAVKGKTRPQSLKMKNLLSGFPNLNQSQKRGLLKLGAGVAGAGGVLLGGSMLADSVIKQKQQQEIARQERLYSNYPAYSQPMAPPDPYGQQRQYY